MTRSMSRADDIATLRARLSAAQQTLAMLIAREAQGDAAQGRRIAEQRAKSSSYSPEETNNSRSNCSSGPGLKQQPELAFTRSFV